MAAPGNWPWKLAENGVTLLVRLTPKGGRDAIDGIAPLADGRSVIKARVAAAPSEGEANSALMQLIANAMSVPARDVTLKAGATGRVKQLAITGDSAVLIAALEKIAAKG